MADGDNNHNEEFVHDGYTYVRETGAGGVCQDGAMLVWVCRRARAWNCKARVWTRAEDGAFHQYGRGNNYSKHTCRNNVAQRLRAAEYWYDIFKFIPRRQHVRNVQPVCRWFNNIGNSIPNLHFIINLERFFDALSRNNRQANRQLVILESGSQDNNAVSLRHIRLSGRIDIGQYLLQQCKQQRSLASLLRLASQLFHGCALILDLANPSTASTILRPDTGYLALLQTVRMSRIFLRLRRDFTNTKMEHLLHQPAILNCSHLYFMTHPQPRAPYFVSTFHWLHHIPNPNNGATMPRQMRIFFYPTPNMDGQMIQQCRQVFEEAQTPDDQRAFVLVTRQPAGDQIALFRINNQRTGEVLLLERHYEYHCLRRCLVAELPTDGDATNRFYQGVTQWHGTMDDYLVGRSPLLRII